MIELTAELEAGRSFWIVMLRGLKDWAIFSLSEMFGLSVGLSCYVALSLFVTDVLLRFILLLC